MPRIVLPDMRIGNRTSRGLTAFLAVFLMLALPSAPSGAGLSPPTVEPDTFPYGVMADEVGPTSAVLWTATTATTVDGLVSTDPNFATFTKRTLTISPDHDGTVSGVFGGLSPATSYFYKFVDPASATESRVGTFQTAPDPSSDVSVSFAFSGDQDGTLDHVTGRPCFNGFEAFTAIRTLAPQFYINLGDTIYADSKCLAHADSSLGEFRSSYKQNLLYDSLRDLMASTSFYTQWDDHEVRNDWTAETVSPRLRRNGTRAFEEYQAVRANPDPNLGFYRRFRWGTEAELFILDERSFRTAEADEMDVDGNGLEDCRNPATHQPDLAPTLSQSWRDTLATQFPNSGLRQPVAAQCTADLEASGRTILGDAQRAQFESDLLASTATFKLVVTEDPVQQLFTFPYDHWEGYRWERAQILSFIDDNDIGNVVWLTTDVHGYLAHVVNANTDTPGTGTQVQGMFEYAVGPIARYTLRQEVNDLFGAGAAPKMQNFFVASNQNTCANLGGWASDPVAPYYGFGLVQIDAATRTISISPIDYTGTHIAGNGGPGGRDPTCYDYVAGAV